MYKAMYIALYVAMYAPLYMVCARASLAVVMSS
jgi:hypothetical protein